ncbi:MAG: hypothetical protein AB7P33_14745 [Dehalococcoidia bacterium]
MRATRAQTGPAWRASARETQRQATRTRGHRKFYTGPILILLFIVVELLLIGRIAGQATSQDPQWSPFATLLWLTDYLVLPFRDLRPEPALKDTGVVEFATLVAVEAYLVAFLALIFLIQLVHICAWFVRRSRRNNRPTLSTVDPQPPASQAQETQQAA